jgi:hypothetical protein
MKYVVAGLLLCGGLSSSIAFAKPQPVSRPPLVKVSPATRVAELRSVPPGERATEQEALEFARAYSPSEDRRRAEIDVTRKNFVAGLRKNPATAQMLDAFPELGDALRDALIGQIDVYMAEFDERFFPQAAALAREYLSREHMRSLTAFYLSPVGRHLLETVSGNVDASEVVASALRGENVTAAEANRQVIRAGIASYGSLSASDRQAIIQMIRSPAGQRFVAVRPKLLELQLQVMNEPGPRFKAAAQEALAAAFARVTGTKPPEAK